MGDCIIESSQNKVVKQIVALQKRKEREKRRLFIAEGERFVGEIPKEWEVDMVATSERFALQHPSLLQSLEMKCPVYVVKEEVFSILSDTQTPQGILAVCRQKSEDIQEFFSKEAPFVILAEELQDPGNLGTLIRTADAAGAHGVILTKGSVDVYNPKVLRSTMGSIFHLPIIQDIDLVELIGFLKQQDITILAAHLQGAVYPYEIDMRTGIMLMVGNEARGLSAFAAEQAHLRIKIPMIGPAESLNVAMAAGILLYEVVRQRLKV